MTTLKRLIPGVLLTVSACVSPAYALRITTPIVQISGAGSSTLTPDPFVGLLPVSYSQGLIDDIGFSVTGPFTFQTGTSAPPSVTYNVSEQINLDPGSYQTSTYLAVDFSDSVGYSASGYLQDFQVITQLYYDSGLTDPVAQSYSSGGQLGFASTGFGPSGTDPFCALSTCFGISSGSTSGQFAVAGGTYYLQQTLTATVANVDPGATITFTLPNSSGVGTPTPEPGLLGVLSGGLAMLALARRRQRT